MPLQILTSEGDDAPPESWEEREEELRRAAVQDAKLHEPHFGFVWSEGFFLEVDSRLRKGLVRSGYVVVMSSCN